MRSLYLQTRMRSAHRDAITGSMIDGMIAFFGESGTPREIRAALKAGRSVVYVSVGDALQDTKLTAAVRGGWSANDGPFPDSLFTRANSVSAALQELYNRFGADATLPLTSKQRASLVNSHLKLPGLEAALSDLLA